MDIVDLSLLAMVFLCAAVFFAAFISSVTGMAGGVLMFSAMSVLIPFRSLIAIHGAVQVINNGFRTLILVKHVKKLMCLYFSIGAVGGTVAMTLLLEYYAGKLMPLIILAVLIFYTLFKPKSIPQIKLKDPYFLVVGFFTGVIGMLAGAIDPFLALFFMRDDLSKEEIVANKSTMQLICHILKVPAFVYLGFSFSDNLYLIALLSVFAILGTKVGVMVLKRIDQHVFFRIMWWALLCSGLYILYKIYQLII